MLQPREGAPAPALSVVASSGEAPVQRRAIQRLGAKKASEPAAPPAPVEAQEQVLLKFVECATLQGPDDGPGTPKRAEVAITLTRERSESTDPPIIIKYVEGFAFAHTSLADPLVDKGDIIGWIDSEVANFLRLLQLEAARTQQTATEKEKVGEYHRQVWDAQGDLIKLMHSKKAAWGYAREHGYYNGGTDAKQDLRDTTTRSGEYESDKQSTETPAAPGEAAPAPEPMGDLSVHFDLDKSDLRADALATLKKAVKAILGDSHIKLVGLDGYTDDSGTAAHNQKLSNARAEAVRTFLTEQGVSPHRLTTKGHGEEESVGGANVDEGTRALNRSVYIHVIERNATPAPNPQGPGDHSHKASKKKG